MLFALYSLVNWGQSHGWDWIQFSFFPFPTMLNTLEVESQVSTVPQRRREQRDWEGWWWCLHACSLFIQHLGDWKQKDQEASLECMKPCSKNELAGFANRRVLWTCWSAVRLGRRVQEGMMWDCECIELLGGNPSVGETHGRVSGRGAGSFS